VEVGEIYAADQYLKNNEIVRRVSNNGKDGACSSEGAVWCAACIVDCRPVKRTYHCVCTPGPACQTSPCDEIAKLYVTLITTVTAQARLLSGSYRHSLSIARRKIRHCMCMPGIERKPSSRRAACDIGIDNGCSDETSIRCSSCLVSRPTVKQPPIACSCQLQHITRVSNEATPRGVRQH
jgi:hypothetical protein